MLTQHKHTHKKNCALLPPVGVSVSLWTFWLCSRIRLRCIMGNPGVITRVCTDILHGIALHCALHTGQYKHTQTSYCSRPALALQ